ncbi:MAG: hypothetical protein ABSG78_18075 [Verrucomicrobiota bacterium]|jgi:hypothetical protein
MKSKPTNEGRENGNERKPPGKGCVESCKQILAQMRKAKDAIFAEAHDTLKAREQMLRLALNEAEALAWQTLYPHLVFPDLAAEKVRGVAAWNSRQQLIGGQSRQSTNK